MNRGANMAKTEKQTKTSAVWFPAKTFGWGWGVPKTWQGWVALVGCLSAGMAPLVYVTTIYKGDTYCKELLDKHLKVSCDPSGASGVYLIGALLWLTAWVLILSMIANNHGEKPSWQWGNKKKHATKPKTD